jgi:hypothetical protein
MCKPENGQTGEISTTPSIIEPKDEYFPWYQGGGMKPKSGREFGVFEKSLEDRANCLSLWTLGYLNPLLSLGSRKVLDFNDVGIPSDGDRASSAYEGTKKEWDVHVIECDKYNAPLKKGYAEALEKCKTDDERAKVKPPMFKEPSVARALIRSFGGVRFTVAMVYYIVSALLSFIPVLILSDLVRYFEHYNSGIEEPYDGFAHPWVEVVLLGCVPVLSSLLQTRHQAVLAHCGVYVRTAVSTMLYIKALKISAAGRAKTSTGQVVNMMSNDTMQLQRFLQFIGLTMVAPLQIVVALYLIYQQVSYMKLCFLPFTSWQSSPHFSALAVRRSVMRLG